MYTPHPMVNVRPPCFNSYMSKREEVKDMEMMIAKNEQGLTIAGVCECGTYISDADGTLEWSNGITVFCTYCA